MVTNGYLLMFGPEHAEEQYKALENHKRVMQEQKILKALNYQNFSLYK